jgi:hypothetical protein
MKAGCAGNVTQKPAMKGVFATLNVEIFGAKNMNKLTNKQRKRNPFKANVWGKK